MGLQGPRANAFPRDDSQSSGFSTLFPMAVVLTPGQQALLGTGGGQNPELKDEMEIAILGHAHCIPARHRSYFKPTCHANDENLHTVIKEHQ